ncbi:recombination protein NinG [Herbaspirillum aquaticum]|uniref:recombination protein NinG n=1 Tax=Herbaspirillum aquaticum TaxID=568783 RepID=UPI0024DE882D|nr:recombination protein NinG [Herbaspirillum aquaticum]
MMTRSQLTRKKAIKNSLPVVECQICKTPFIQFRMGQVVCKPACLIKQLKALEKAEKDAAKAQRAADKARLHVLDPKRKSKARAKAKKALHAFVRERDLGKSCISCSTILKKAGKLGGDYDAGHFRSVGSNKSMEFVERNIHGQCKRCNRDLRGNALEYQRGLIARYGQAYVDELLADQKVRKLTVDDFETIEKIYTQKLKDLLAARAEGQAC